MQAPNIQGFREWVNKRFDVGHFNRWRWVVDGYPESLPLDELPVDIYYRISPKGSMPFKVLYDSYYCHCKRFKYRPLDEKDFQFHFMLTFDKCNRDSDTIYGVIDVLHYCKDKKQS